MNFQGEDVVAIGWKEPQANKAVGLVILYTGSDIEIAAKIINDALDANTIMYGRAFRGPFGGGQCLYRASRDNRPGPAFSEVLPPTSGRANVSPTVR